MRALFGILLVSLPCISMAVQNHEYPAHSSDITNPTSTPVERHFQSNGPVTDSTGATLGREYDVTVEIPGSASGGLYINGTQVDPGGSTTFTHDFGATAGNLEFDVRPVTPSSEGTIPYTADVFVPPTHLWTLTQSNSFGLGDINNFGKIFVMSGGEIVITGGNHWVGDDVAVILNQSDIQAEAASGAGYISSIAIYSEQPGASICIDATRKCYFGNTAYNLDSRSGTHIANANIFNPPLPGFDGVDGYLFDDIEIGGLDMTTNKNHTVLPYGANQFLVAGNYRIGTYPYNGHYLMLVDDNAGSYSINKQYSGPYTTTLGQYAQLIGTKVFARHLSSAYSVTDPTTGDQTRLPAGGVNLRPGKDGNIYGRRSFLTPTEIIRIDQNFDAVTADIAAYMPSGEEIVGVGQGEGKIIVLTDGDKLIGLDSTRVFESATPITYNTTESTLTESTNITLTETAGAGAAAITTSTAATNTNEFFGVFVNNL